MAGHRPGTENVASIVALGTACRISAQRLAQEQTRLAVLSVDLFGQLSRMVPGLMLLGEPNARLPNTLTVLFPGASGRQILRACPYVLASTVAREATLGAVRLSLGRATSAEDVEIAAASLASAWRTVREPTLVHLVRPLAGKPRRSPRRAELKAADAGEIRRNQ
jgi:cysteine desulfurase